MTYQKVLWMICCSLIGLQVANAQQEPANYKSVMAKFKNHYNKGQFDSIYNMYGTDMQKLMPLEKTSKFFSTTKDSLGGQLLSTEFDNQRSSIVNYKAKFEKSSGSISISIDSASQKIRRFAIRFPKTNDTISKIQRNITPLALPVKGEWTVTWGGDTKEQNQHFNSGSQKAAFDLVIRGKDGKSYKTDGKSNQDYYAFGQEIVSPCDGEVVLVVDGVKDNLPMAMNPMYAPGNSVIIKTANNEYLVFAHFKQQSIKVKQGEKIKQGKLLGLCGNSGNSSEPHLHFHIQNAEDINTATAIKCYFNNLLVNGVKKADYSPVKNEKIQAP